jgi:hypothetical protein
LLRNITRRREVVARARVNPKALARSVAYARTGFGATLLVAPRAIHLLLGDTEGKATVQMSIRALGARDLILGLGVRATLDHEPAAAAGMEPPR